ncbi:aminoacyl-histidine dipeptidase [Dysgonomonas sp. 521]|uniref:aminoacyl-histidine dipeptidase n=1 Tax=Dysgonomonas sp. 521 TaxID=2302932 RepID=UPI0013D533FA|nr:aminoacyl-histidine dipeptidase [Dysgonomonas sp. 521]NDV94477.1 aminoacyl-histidine dipeptidase [Dysgonomonas sp. 521]
MTIKDLKPSGIWNYFYEITQIPRPSKKEEKIIAYLLEFAKKHNLEVKKDDAGNVLITKPATKGKENLPTVILQGHVDMVCEKNSGTKHDFDKDPIETYVDGDWLKAKGTTLGADNGMGMAAALAILASDTIEHGKLECLFTVDEETGLTGAYALGKDFLNGDILINLDTEEEGEIYIGCAGGKITTVTFTYKKEDVPANYFWFKVQVNGLNGGHSGSEIHKGLGNANKVLNRYLWALSRKYKLAVAEIDGGNLHNAIAREAYAIAGVPYGDKEHVIVELNTLAPDIEAELKAVDPNVKMTVASTDAPSFVIDKDTTINLLNGIYACPHGVLAMSHEIPGLVETSTNLASVKMKDDNKIVITTSQRSSTNSLKDDAGNIVNAVFTLAKAEVVHSAGYPGWKPNPDSKVLAVAKKAYKDLFGKDAEIMAIHAGLECGLFLEKYPHLDMISCGPTIRNAHSPEEQIEIASVEKWWVFLLETLKNIPAK